ncbi:MAG: hypothetical protein MJ188_01730 [Treponema sp.]|nr:hypothetical protein [Treponema sp.]
MLNTAPFSAEKKDEIQQAMQKSNVTYSRGKNDSNEKSFNPENPSSVNKGKKEKLQLYLDAYIRNILKVLEKLLTFQKVSIVLDIRRIVMEIIKWEYKEVRSDTEEDLIKLGKQGWESVLQTNNGQILFKRPCGKIQVIEKENPAEVEIKQSADFNLDQKKTGSWGY